MTAPPARFEDRGEIGRGGMGIVRLLFDRLLGRRVALKELVPGCSADEVARFVAEARTTGMLDHPNILPVYDLWRDAPDRPPRLLMKLVEGRTLRDILHQAPRPRPDSLEFERVLRIVLAVCDAIAFAHARRIVHRDLHPANVMVGDHGQVYVMDWGLARKLDDPIPREPGAAPGSVVGGGTVAYMAPEQAWGRDHEVDERTDVFGLGGILYEVLTLRPPFPGPHFDDSLHAARAGRVAHPDTVVPGGAAPARLCEIVLRALAPERERRYQSVQALRDELEAFLRSGGCLTAQHFPAGGVMLEEGAPSDRAYIVTEGACEVFRRTGSGSELLRVVGPGGVVGEVGLFTGAPRNASVRALTDVRVLVVTRAALDQELGRADWMRAFVDAAIERFAELDEAHRPPAGGPPTARR